MDGPARGKYPRPIHALGCFPNMTHMQGLRCRQGLGHGSQQATPKAVKIEESPQTCSPGEAALGEVKADPESLQPAQDTAQAIASSKPAVTAPCTPSKAAEGACVAKQARSKAEDAPAKPSAKRSGANSASQVLKAQKRAARQPGQPGQPSSKAALGEVKADPESPQPAQNTAQAIASSKPAVATRCIPGRAAAAAGIAKRLQSEAEDVSEMLAAKRSRTTSASRALTAQKKASRHGGRRAQLGQQEAPAGQAFGFEDEVPQAGRFGNLVTDTPQYLIIGGENPSQWTKGRICPRPWSHGGNHFWEIAELAGVVTHAVATGTLKAMLKVVGFMDIGLAKFLSSNASPEGDNFRETGKGNTMAWYREHAPGFYARVLEQTQRACASIGCECGECGAPAFFVWNGKTPWRKLLKIDSIPTNDFKCGLQTAKPKDWPLPARTKVYVMPSTSGANHAHFDDDGGLGTWEILGRAIRAHRAANEWPPKPQCCQRG